MFPKKLFVLLLSLSLVMMTHGQVANRFDVLITEIMADPSPAIGLPNAEYIEIRNVSGASLQLQGWKLSDASSTATISASILLPADSLLILCSHANQPAFAVFGKAVGISNFPSLDNDGELLVLRSTEGRVIHAVDYRSGWHPNSIKKDGGWSLEMKDLRNPCSGKQNWTASHNASGGTPGKTNSVQETNTDLLSPRLLRTYSIDSLTIVAVFDESLDSVSAANGSYHLPGNTITIAQPLAPLFHSVALSLSSPLHKESVYELVVSNVTDCSNNPISGSNKAKAGIAEPAAEHDMIINEILFNPGPGGFDFVECYNNSNKPLDLSGLLIANRNSTGEVSNAKKLMESPYYIFPGEFVVITEDQSQLRNEYFCERPDQVLEVASLPSFPDDKGYVILTDAQGFIIDEVPYTEKWHFALVTNNEGVSLERIDPSGPSSKPNNWHTASSTSGYATPTYLNSQHKRYDSVRAFLGLNPPVFSPDNDGFDDLATLSYRLSENGYVANITIFNSDGRPVRSLVRNELLGIKGSWNWDGLDDKQQRLRPGIYIVLTELFNLQGKKKIFKTTVVLARRN